MAEQIKNPSAGLNNFQKADQIFEQTFKSNAEKINEVNGSLGQGFFDLMEESVREGQDEIYDAIQKGDKKEVKTETKIQKRVTGTWKTEIKLDLLNACLSSLFFFETSEGLF